MSRSKWIVEKIFPARRIHILAGASGSNKTTYLLQHLFEWEKGRPLHGYSSFPVPWVYVTCDRSREETEETFTRMGIDLNAINTVYLLDEKYRDVRTIETLFSRLTKEFPDARLYVIDAFYTLTPGGKYNDNATVNDFLRTIVRLCDQHDVTIIGTHHSPKMKEGDGYVAARDCILGAIAWGAFSSTVLHIRSPKPEDPACLERTLAILPRNGAALVLEYVLDDHGCLKAAPAKRKDGPAQTLRDFVMSLKIDEEFDSAEAIAAAGATRQYTHKLVMDLVKEGMIERVDRGAYKRVKSPSEAFFGPVQ